MKWDTADEKDSRVVKSTAWIALADTNKLEARAGVYIFADDTLDVKYIGKAGGSRIIVEGNNNMGKRMELIEIADALGRKKGRGATKVKVLYTNSGPLAFELEQRLISKYDPDNNGVNLIKD